MGKKARGIVAALLLLVFAGSGGAILLIKGRYQQSRQNYDQAVSRYTVVQQESEEAPSEKPPITVDFQALCAAAPDVVGWLYCEGTDLNYPVVQGLDNDFYLRHSYDKTPDKAGAIFVGAQNAAGFADSNTIVYGHHMTDGSMFACLSKWMEPSYFKDHRVMWLLTPKADYKLLLFSGYTTSAYSDTYTIFKGPGKELEDYLKRCKDQSIVSVEEELDPNGRYLLLSTCAYDFADARYVLHGRLELTDGNKQEVE